MAMGPHGRAGADRGRSLDPDPLEPLRAGLAAIAYLEHAVTSIEWGEGLVLRYGSFYGRGPRSAWLPMR